MNQKLKLKKVIPATDKVRATALSMTTHVNRAESPFAIKTPAPSFAHFLKPV